MHQRRALAARIAGQAELRDIQLFGLHAVLEHQPIAGKEIGFELQTSLGSSLPSNSNTLVVQGDYELKTWQKTEADGRDTVATFNLQIAALYELPVDEAREYTEEEVQAFADTTGQFALYPFVRQHINDLTSRLSLPPLTLGILRFELDADEAGTAHASSH